MTSIYTQNAVIRALQKELKELQESPIEGFKVSLVDDSNLFIWDVVIFGPPETLYEGGYFKARLTFPTDYPYSPPSMRFISKMFHPNIFENGVVCISILHSQGEDIPSDELPSEKWNPTQNVRTILLSVISLLNEPNVHSSAHAEASVAYRKLIESKGKEKSYENKIRSIVERTKADAKRDGVTVPTTLEDYCLATRLLIQRSLEDTKSGLEYGIDDDFSFPDNYNDCIEDCDDDDDESVTETSETTSSTNVTRWNPTRRENLA